MGEYCFLWSGYVVPSTLSVGNSTVAVVMVALAGRKNVTGALVMTVAYSYFTHELAASGSVYSNVILGILLVLIVMFMPEGALVGLFDKIDGLSGKIASKKRKTVQRGK